MLSAEFFGAVAAARWVMSVGMLRAQDVSFDYSLLTSDVAAEASAAAKRIRENQEFQFIAMIEIGQDLISIKNKLEHGLFGDWLRMEFKMSDRTARNYMNVARKLGDRKDLVAKLPAKTLYALASPRFPAPIRDRVIGLLGAPDSIAAVHAEVDQVRLARVVRSDRSAAAVSAASLPSVNAAAECAAEKAADLLEARFVEDLPALVELLTAADYGVLLRALQQRVAGLALT